MIAVTFVFLQLRKLDISYKHLHYSVTSFEFFRLYFLTYRNSEVDVLNKFFHSITMIC